MRKTTVKRAKVLAVDGGGPGSICRFLPVTVSVSVNDCGVWMVKSVKQ